MYGQAKYQQYNELILGTDAHLYTKNNILHVNQGLYHLISATNSDDNISRDIWGKADTITRYGDKQMLVMTDATYTTCSPIKPVWHVSATKLTLNKKTGKGVARNIVVSWKRIPFFYSPYYSFPIDNRRKTGFLTPTFSYSHSAGSFIGLPFYWNLAPNYDDLITPIWFTKRGIQLNNLFRYMGNDQTRGQMYLSFLPGDKLFKQFQKDGPQQYPTKKTYLDQLKDFSSNRGFLSANYTNTFNRHWSLSWNANYVTDPYYFQAFSLHPGQSLANQLDNNAKLKFHSSHWHAQVLTQAFQTLHPINQPAAADQYQLLPQVDIGFSYPQVLNLFNFSMSSEWTKFSFANTPFLTKQPPIGERLHARPTISLPMQFAGGFITPAFSLDATSYDTQRPALPTSITNATRTIPITDVKAGLFFESKFHFGTHHFTQTLQPEVNYLYVPYKKQQNLPVFDTGLLPFNYSQVLALNEFNGLDRIQNANQLGLSLDTQTINSDTGTTRLDTQLGMIYYMTARRVKLYPTDTDKKSHFSELAAQSTFTPNNLWSATGSLAWNLKPLKENNSQQQNTAGLTFSYHQTADRTLSLGYQYVTLGDTNYLSNGTSKKVDLNILNMGLGWKLNQHWNSVNYVNYNFGQKLLVGFFTGLQYDSCCWDINFLVNRNFISYTPQNRPKMQNTYFFQLTFKGLGSFGEGTPRGMLQADIPGFSKQNNFGL